MSDKVCPNCNYLFEEGDIVVAEVEAYWKVLKSKVAYAIEKPFACNWVEHRNCEQPKGKDPNDSNI